MTAPDHDEHAAAKAPAAEAASEDVQRTPPETATEHAAADASDPGTDAADPGTGPAADAQMADTAADAVEGGAEAEAPEQSGEAETAENGAGTDDPEEDVAAEAALAAEYYDRLIRLQAEFENYRKRMQRERESDVKYAGERFVQAMLPVLDNFERALAAIPDSEETQAWRQGIVMIQRQLIEVLEKEGVTAVVADPGTPFDPHQHEAVFYEESSEFGEGQIIAELQRGYRLHDRLIRPALVRVAQG